MLQVDVKHDAEAFAFDAISQFDHPGVVPAEIVAGWRPLDTDWARLFLHPDQVRDAYDAFWATPAEVAKRGRHKLQIGTATVEELRAGAVGWSAELHAVAHALVPGPIWCRFRRSPLSGPVAPWWEGLVVIDERVVFCPDPGRYVGP